MDIRQYGPALFLTVKQVRSILDESSTPPTHARHENIPGEPGSNPLEDPRGGTSYGK